MGWIGYPTLAEAKAKVLTPEWTAKDGCKIRLVSFKQVRGAIWTLHEVDHVPNCQELDHSTFITVYLFDGCMVKTLGEASGPYRYDCPLEYLDRAPLPTYGYGAAWREKVRAVSRANCEQVKTSAFGLEYKGEGEAP